MLNINILKQIRNFNADPGQELAWLAGAEKLNLSWSRLSGYELAEIINHAPNLKKLWLNGCKYLRPLSEILNTLYPIH